MQIQATARRLLAAVFALAFGLLGASSASALTSPYAYDAAAYTYDTAANMSTTNATVEDTLGSPTEPRAVPWVSHASVAQLGDAAETGTAAVSQVTANKTAGDAFRDQVAGRLESEMGFNIIGIEVPVKTPLGTRVIDILAERNGGLVNFETKLGGSRYLPGQRAKDWWIANGGIDVLGNGTTTTFPTVVIRGPLP